MVKLQEVKSLPKKKSDRELIQEFAESKMGSAKLVLDGDRSPQSVYSGIYQYLRNHPELKVRIQMVDGDLFLSRT